MPPPSFSESTRLDVPADYAFAPDGEACTYTWAMECRSSGPLGAIIGHVFARFMHSNAQAQQRLFREEVERRFRDEHRAGGPTRT